VYQCALDLFEVQPPAGELGGREPSQIVDAVALLNEIDRLAPEAAQVRERVERIVVALAELAKFIPDERERAAGDDRISRPWIAREIARWRAVAEQLAAEDTASWPAPPPRGTLDPDALDAHFKWVRRGKTGEGRLELTSFDARARKLDEVDLTAARLEAVRLSRASLELALLREAELIDLDLAGAHLRSVKLGAAVARGCRFDRALLAHAELDHAHVARCSFERVTMDRSSWRSAVIEDCNLRLAAFGDTVLDGARFQRCDLRGVQLEPRHPRVVASSRGTVFERCDFRGADFSGRDLASASFIACKFAGAHGLPGATEGWSVEAADFSTEGDGSDLGDAADLLDYLS
jgi:uncharacterized protein YjbI with pentapeptide repeats